jgi:hypothetical protein
VFWDHVPATRLHDHELASLIAAVMTMLNQRPTSPTDEPLHLREPFLAIPSDDRWRQTTDPLVFADQFLYSNYRQPRNRRLTELAGESRPHLGGPEAEWCN